ncbi:MAG: hypothetical protein ACLRWQ_16630 [Flavonifractor plautii]
MEIGTKPVCTNPRCITQTEHYLPPLVRRRTAAWTAAASVTPLLC